METLAMVTCQSKCILQNSVIFATGNFLYLKKWKIVATNDSIRSKINHFLHFVAFDRLLVKVNPSLLWYLSGFFIFWYLPLTNSGKYQNKKATKTSEETRTRWKLVTLTTASVKKKFQCKPYSSRETWYPVRRVIYNLAMPRNSRGRTSFTAFSRVIVTLKCTPPFNQHVTFVIFSQFFYYCRTYLVLLIYTASKVKHQLNFCWNNFRTTVKLIYWTWKIFIRCETLHKYLNENWKIHVIFGFCYKIMGFRDLFKTSPYHTEIFKK